MFYRIIVYMELIQSYQSMTPLNTKDAYSVAID